MVLPGSLHPKPQDLQTSPFLEEDFGEAELLSWCGGLNENGPHRLVCLKTWSPDEGARMESCGPLESEASLEEVGNWWAGLESLKPSSTSCSFSASCFTTMWGSDTSSCILLQLRNFLLPNFFCHSILYLPKPWEQ